MAPSPMFFQSLTREREIGANSYCLDLGETRLVLDSGMHPKREGVDSLPLLESLEYDSADALFITHSHLDHMGSLPVAMRRHPNAKVYMTEPTGLLIEAMLHNSVNVMTSKREELEIRDYPFFTHREIDMIQGAWHYRQTRKPFRVSSDVECIFYDAGHVMGSVGIMLKVQGKTVFYTGDVKFTDQTLCRGADFPKEPVDVMIVETTHGAKPVSEAVTWESEVDRLAETIIRTFERDGAVLIPVFALGKTQEILMILHLMIESGRLPSCPVIIGGLSTKVTTIFDKMASRVRRHHQDFRILDEMSLTVASRRSNRDIRCQPHSIYALSSGMMTEKTVSNKFARGFIDNPDNSLIFVGYSDPDSPAGKIRASQRGDLISLDPLSEPVPFDCEMVELDFSGHANREQIRQYVNTLRPKKVLLVHGDEEAQDWFHARFREDFGGECEIFQPNPNERLEIGGND